MHRSRPSPAARGTGQCAASNTPDSIASLTLANGSQVLLVANFYANTVSVLESNGNGEFNWCKLWPPAPAPMASRSATYGDGNQDFAVANYYSSTVSIFMGDGAATSRLARR